MRLFKQLGDIKTASPVQLWAPMTRAPFFLLTALLGFYTLYEHTTFRPAPRSPLTRYLPGLPPGITVPAALWQAMVTGEDRDIPANVKAIYYQLGLGHLFTPSGTHLATLTPLLRRISYGFVFYLGLASLSLLVPGLLALSRVAWLKGLNRAKPSFASFCCILIFEGISFSWRLSPIGWLCSWLFLGLTYFATRRALVLWYLVAQMLLSWVFHQGLSILSFPTSLLFGLPLLLLFPLLLTLSFFPWSGLHQLTLTLLGYLHSLIMNIAQLHFWLPPIDLHAGHLILGIAFITLGRQYKTIICTSILLLLSAPTGQWQRETVENSKWEIGPASSAQLIIVKTKNKFTSTIWSDGTTCRHQLVQGVWRRSCRAHIRPGKRKRLKKLSS